MRNIEISDPWKLFESLPMGLALCEMDGSIVYVNAAFTSIVDYTPEELLALNYWQLTPEKYKQQEEVQLQLLTSHGRYGPYEKEYIHRNGSLIPVRLNGEVVEVNGSNYIWSSVEKIADSLAVGNELLRSEERFRTLFESANDCLLLLSMDGTITDINEVGASGLGYSKQEMVGRNISEFDSPEFSPKLPERLEQIRQNGQAKFESAHVCKDGTVMPIEVSSRMIEMHGRSFYFSVIRDISESKAMSEDLNRREVKYRAVIETSPDGFWVTDMQGKIIEVNEAYARLSGYSREELLTMAIPDVEAREAPEETKAHIEEIQKTGSARFESEHRAKDGTVYPVEIVTSIWPVDEPLFFVFIVDISERKKAEARLNKLSQAVERGGEGVMITDKDSVIEYVNPAFTAITGYSSEEVIGKKPSLLKSSAQDPSFYTELWQTITSGHVWHGSLIDRRKDGVFYPTLMSIAPIFDDSGEIGHYVAVQQDMSEYKKMEQQFHQSQKLEALGTLVGGIAHDFNNMLAGIIGNTYMLKKRSHEDEKALKNLDTIDRLCEKAAGMIKQMLAYARADYIKPETFLLNEMLRESLHLSEAAIPENIEQHIDITSQGLYIHGDTIQLQQVLINIINNARDAIEDKFADKGEGIISCTLSSFMADSEFLVKHPSCKGESFACLTISDNGCGIPVDQLNKVFDPFYTTKGVDKGNGLGLSMVYGAIHNHQGTIEVQSTVGEGTSFIIYLPLSEKVERLQEPEPAAVQSTALELIIVADDEDLVREMYAEVLSDFGYQVRVAKDGLDAVQLYEENQTNCALLILDVVMPKMGGVDAARVIRQSDDSIPIIFSTGYDKDVALKNTEGLRNFEAIGKPFDVDAFIETVRRLIGKS